MDAVRHSPILRQISVSSVMTMLRRHKARSRADLAKDTGLSKQTMSEVIRALEQAGWVRETGVATGRVGRAAVLYEIDDRVGAVLGIDLGATRLRIWLADVRGQVLGQTELATADLSSTDIAGAIAGHARALMAENAEGRSLMCCCLATPGVVDPSSGQLMFVPTLPSIAGRDLAAELGEALGGCHIVLENDVNAAAIGERWRGTAQATDFTGFISLGTGIGLGLILGGQLMRGARGAAGEVGYMPFGSGADGAGMLEPALGGQGLLERWKELGGTGETLPELTVAATLGDAGALQVLTEAGRLAARLALSVQAMVDPEIIVLGGTLGSAPTMFDAVQRDLSELSGPAVQLRLSELGRTAPVTGALSIAIEALYEETFTPDHMRG